MVFPGENHSTISTKEMGFLDFGYSRRTGLVGKFVNVLLLTDFSYWTVVAGCV